MILFEDNHLLAVDKPAGICTQPNESADGNDLETQVKAWIKEKYQKPGDVFLHAVHRLDKPVSGIVLFAKTSKALSRLNEAIRSKQCKKIYLALVEGQIKPPQGSLTNYLLHESHHSRVVAEGVEGAQLARLHYELIENLGNHSLVRVELETGRYHQIRVQLAHAGYPIVGDVRYGSVTAREGIALHHSCFIFPHPITKEMIKVESSSFAPLLKRD